MGPRRKGSGRYFHELFYLVSLVALLSICTAFHRWDAYRYIESIARSRALLAQN